MIITLKLLMKELFDLIDNPIKASITTLSGTILGYVPQVGSTIESKDMTYINTLFQHGIWTLTGIVAIFAIISAIQKQVDRYRAKHPSRYIYNDDDND